MAELPYGFELTQLLNIIKPLPEIKILMAGSDDLIPLVTTFEDALQSNGGVIDILSLSEKAQPASETIRQHYKAEEFVGKIRAYEGLIYVLGEADEHYLKWLLPFYHALENSGDFIMLLNPEIHDSWVLKEQLNEANFVAINDIPMAETSMVITAKKMHGWGGGM